MSRVAAQTAGRVGSLGVGSASSACRLAFCLRCWTGLWVGSRAAVLVCGELGRFAAERRGGSGRPGAVFAARCGFCCDDVWVLWGMSRMLLGRGVAG
jgi:hypothetical protein